MSSQDGLCSYRFDTYRNCIKAAAASHSIPKNDREAATESNDKTREREGESGSKAMDSDLQAVEQYLRAGVYPSGFSKGEKVNLRRKCRNNYKFEDGVLLFRKCIGRQAGGEWRICVRTVEDKKRILQSCHGETAGGHFGRDKTIEKVCSRFFWKDMVEEIRTYVKNCPKCQKMNANFVKTIAQLHSVQVQPKVWSQVRYLDHLVWVLGCAAQKFFLTLIVMLCMILCSYIYMHTGWY